MIRKQSALMLGKLMFGTLTFGTSILSGALMSGTSSRGALWMGAELSWTCGGLAMRAARIAAAAAGAVASAVRSVRLIRMAVILPTGRARSKKIKENRTVGWRMGLLAATLEINQWLTDALKVSLYLGVGVEVVLRVVAHQIAVLALNGSCQGV